MAVSAAMAGAEALPPGRATAVNPWLIAVLVKALASFMEVLDTTIANVVLPYIAGGMGVSEDGNVLGGDDVARSPMPSS